MALEDISRIDDAIEKIKRALQSLEQEIARYNIAKANENLKRLEELCSYLYTHKIKIKRKQSENVNLIQSEYTILAMDLETVLKRLIPMLYNCLNRYYETENIYSYRIPNAKNIRQEDGINLLWSIRKELKIIEDYEPSILHETIFQKVKL